MRAALLSAALIFIANSILSVNSQCSVNIREQIPVRDAVYIKQTAAGMVPWAPDGPALTWQPSEVTYVACTGSGNALTTDGTRDATMTCQGGNTFLMNGQLRNSNDVGCTNTITGDTINTGAGCPNGGTILNLGFNTNSFGFVTYIQSCYNMQTGSVVYTRHILPGKAINHAVIESARPAFKSAGTPPHVNPGTAYLQASQIARLTQLLGSADLANKYIVTNSRFMARGHLAPDGDGIYRSWQFTTYFFTNVAPQWQSMNNGNWLRVEDMARNKAGRMQEDMLIFTGVHGVLTLDDVNGNPVKITLEEGGNIEVPKWYWKIIKSPRTNAGIAIMSLNNPYAERFSASEMLCTDICATTGWHHVNFGDVVRGLTFCCTVTEFMSSVSAAPAEAYSSSVLTF